MDGESLLESLIEVASLAERELKVASAWIKGDVLERVLEKLKRNVQVEVILKAGEREDMNITDIRVFRAVRKKGGRVYVNPRLHAKFLLVDDRIAFVGSANLTYSGTQTEFGNFEAVVKLEEGEYVKELIKKYEELKRESEEIFPDTVAVVLSFENSLTFRSLLLEDVPEQSFLKVQSNRGIMLCKLISVESYTFDESQLMGKDKDKDWLVAFLKAYFNETGNVKLGRVRVLCEYRKIRAEEKESYFGVPLLPLAVGTQLFLTDQSDPDMQAVMGMNMSGYPMDKKVYIGKLLNTNVDVYLDLSKVSSMHMAVMGTTGAGKTTFVRRLIENLGKNYVKVYVMDVFGEYYEKLSIERERMEHIKLPYTLFPVHVDDVKELFKAYGVGIQEKSLEEKNFFANIRRVLKPDIETIAYRDKNFEEILLTSSTSPRIEEELEDFLRILKRDFGDMSVNNQREIYRLIKMGLSSEKDMVLYDLKDVLNVEARINIVGLVMKEIFIASRLDGKGRLIALEEAHNFAPERGALEIPFGRENIAYTMTRRIALEGRKFGVGLIAITQRPANISKYILSQMNTQAIFRLITKNDLDAVSVFFEESNMELLNILPSLRPGILFLNGLAVPFGMLVSIEL